MVGCIIIAWVDRCSQQVNRDSDGHGHDISVLSVIIYQNP